MSDKELNYSLLWHTLGISERNTDEYRNYFEASAGHSDMPDLLRLVDYGYMKQDKPPSFCSKDSILFRVTEKGKIIARETVPKPPKLSKSKQRYQNYLRLDLCISFKEFLTSPEFADLR